MRKNIVISIISVVFIYLFCSLASLSSTSIEKIKTLDIYGFFEYIDVHPSTQIIDIRPSEMRAAGYMKNSKNISINSIQARLREIKPGETIVVYSQDGRSSQEAAQIFEYNFKTNVYILENGIDMIYDFLSREREIVAKNAYDKKYFLKIREQLITSKPIVGLRFPIYGLQGKPDKRTTLAEFAGRPILLAFFSASDNNQFSEIVRLKKTFYGTLPKIVFLPVAVYKSKEELAKFERTLKKNSWTGQIFYDEGKTLMRRIGVNSLPNYNIIDGTGVLRVLDFTGKRDSIESYEDKTLPQLASVVASGDLPPYPIPIAELSEFRQKKLIGVTAPDFTLPSALGSQITLSSYKNKKNIFLIFGSIDCPYTRKEMETANACYEKYKNINNFLVLSVVPGGQEILDEKARVYIDQQHIAFQILLSPTLDVFDRYYISSVPVWWMLDKSGVIRARGKGYNPDTCTALLKVLK